MRPAGSPGTRARRNAAVGAATAGIVVALLIYPTSTHRGGHEPAPLAPVGLVATPVAHEPMAGMDMSAGEVGQPAIRVVDGPPVDTMYGPVQVQIHVLDGEILSATAIEYPHESMVDKVLNADAIPTLEREALAAQGARIDTVSGATYTSEGYRGSLQAAIDSAHL